MKSNLTERQYRYNQVLTQSVKCEVSMQIRRALQTLCR